MKALLLLAAAFAAAGCIPEKPRVRYQGSVVERAAIPTDSMEVFRTGPPRDPYRDLGTVSVTCPSESEVHPFGRAAMVGGCSYERAVRLAAERAAQSGADGIHSIDSGVNAAGAVVSLRATAYYYATKKVVPRSGASLPNPDADVAKPATEDEGAASIEERLKRLEKLKDAGLVTPEEYAAKRAEILQEI